jgi:hypothetical protein
MTRQFGPNASGSGGSYYTGATSANGSPMPLNMQKYMAAQEQNREQQQAQADANRDRAIAASGTGSFMHGGNAGTNDRSAYAQSGTGAYFPGDRAGYNSGAGSSGTGGGGAGYGSYGAGGGASGGGMSSGLAGSYQNAYNEAVAENEARYRDILGGYQDRYERNMNYLNGAGQQEAADIGEQYRKQGSNIQQGLVNRGLSNSTVLDTMQMGNNREYVNDLGRLDERLRQQRIATDAGLSGDELQFMERRNDTYPDYNQLAQLEEGLGAAGGGYGGGGAIYADPQSMGYIIPGAAYGGYGVAFGGGGNGGGGNGGNGGGLTPAQQNMANRRQATEDRRQSLKNAVAAGFIPGFG